MNSLDGCSQLSEDEIVFFDDGGSFTSPRAGSGAGLRGGLPALSPVGPPPPLTLAPRPLSGGASWAAAGGAAAAPAPRGLASGGAPPPSYDLAWALASHAAAAEADPPPLAPGSLPARSGSAVQMGTSVPIAIPCRWPSASGRAGAPQLAPPPAGAAREPFVPPHQLTARVDFGLQDDGASPSACVKRDRLRSRNAILRVTGFMDGRA